MRQLKANRRKEASVQCDGAVHSQAAFADVEDDAAAVVAQVDVGERVQPAARETAPFMRKDAGAGALWFVRQKGTKTKRKPWMFWRADYTPGGQLSSEKFAKVGCDGESFGAERRQNIAGFISQLPFVPRGEKVRLTLRHRISQPAGRSIIGR